MDVQRGARRRDGPDAEPHVSGGTGPDRSNQETLAMAQELRGGDERLPDDDDPFSMAASFPIHQDLVARRAYERYRRRGSQDGRDQEDWVEAERELIAAQLEGE